MKQFGCSVFVSPIWGNISRVFDVRPDSVAGYFSAVRYSIRHILYLFFKFEFGIFSLSKYTVGSFCRALHAMKNFEKPMILVFENYTGVKNYNSLPVFSIMSILESLVFKILIQRTSQCVKWSIVINSMN